MAPLKLISWNVNGIRAAEKKGFLDWLHDCGGDVVAIQETKAHPDQLSKALLGPEGYAAEFCAAEKKGYSGVATYSRVRPLRTVAGLGNKTFDADGRTLISEFDSFVLFNIYFPNGGRGPAWVAPRLFLCVDGFEGADRGGGYSPGDNGVRSLPGEPDPGRLTCGSASERHNHFAPG